MTRNEILLQQQNEELFKIENKLCAAWDEYMISKLNQAEINKWIDARSNCKKAIAYYMREIEKDSK